MNNGADLKQSLVHRGFDSSLLNHITLTRVRALPPVEEQVQYTVELLFESFVSLALLD